MLFERVLLSGRLLAAAELEELEYCAAVDGGFGRAREDRRIVTGSKEEARRVEIPLL